jgi:hypothetical protein
VLCCFRWNLLFEWLNVPVHLLIWGKEKGGKKLRKPMNGVRILSSSYILRFPSFLHGFVTRGQEKINGWNLKIKINISLFLFFSTTPSSIFLPRFTFHLLHQRPKCCLTISVKPISASNLCHCVFILELITLNEKNSLVLHKIYNIEQQSCIKKSALFL